MLYLVRHGQSEFNAERRLQGQLDIPLTDEGRRQAEALAESLCKNGPRVGRIYCSRLKRAGETARIIGRRLGLTPITVGGIEEINFGKFQGHTFEECARLFPNEYADYLIKKAASNAHGGETGRQVMERAREALLKLREAKEGSALVVCHGAVIGYLRGAVMGVPLDDIKELIPGNAEVIPFTSEDMEKLRNHK
ncbi:MAG: histidine phosphatase family protein [Clostridiales bacterium]|nr:histidine phosphatase family protein [Clostridiales bacterium]